LPSDAIRDPERLALLRRTRLLDAPPEPAFDRLTRLASRLVHAPIALVTLIDEDRQFFLSCVGLPEPLSEARQTPLTSSICKHLVATDEPLIAPDLSAHPLLASDASLRAFGIGAYAGIPLRTATGHVLGSFCVLDRVPREWTEEQIEMLTTLANSAIAEIELRSALDRQAQQANELAASRDAARALVAERTAALEQLRVSEERFRLVERATNDVIYDWDILTGALTWNAALVNTMRHRPEDVPNIDAWVKQIHADDVGSVSASLHLALSGGGESWSHEYRFRRGDGSTATVLDRGHVLRDANGRAVRMIGSMADLTERKRTEEALREASETVRALVDASPLAIIVSDFSDIVHVWNPAAERLFGWSAAEVIGKRVPHVPDDAHLEIRLMRETTQQGGSITGLVTQRVRRDGSRIDVDQSTAPLRDAAGQPKYVITILADITEQRLLEGQLRQSQKMEAVGRLAGGVAHDFNNLLTVIRANADFLREDVGDNAELRLGIDEIRQAADRAAALTRQLLVFSRRQVVQPKTVQLNEIVSGMEQMLGRLIGENIVLASVLEPDLGTVHADVGQMEQVLLNLVVNARDAMPLGGAIVVTTASVKLGPEAAGWSMPVQPGDYVQWTVSDTGCGMTPDVQVHIFEPFFTTKEPGKGTGLGLSTVYGIVQQMEGSIVVRSDPGQGAIFTLYLPLVKAAEDVSPPSDARDAQRSGTETILLVEDEDAVRRLAKRALEMNGYRVLEASHGGEALRVCEKHAGTIDLLLTDVVMPQMSGAELAERVKPLRPDMQVLFMSGYTEDALGNHGVLAPETAFLYKPFTPDSLRRRVREVLDAARRAS
jgi:PAS domain S-box-containing protein